MVREDGALAQRLQEEEFGNHYLRNRSERKTVREDVKAAKITYLEEVRNAQILPVAEVHNIYVHAHVVTRSKPKMKSLVCFCRPNPRWEQTEQWLASDLQHKLRQEEIARHLQEKESL
ncbi:uncharacterized protein [Montipora foliosa]|uniref:uncharacterized protein n=1 Tax=Montipora foliosa TaxID=591990 RepID=UPI0035F138FD